YEDNGTYKVAKIWKNGVAQDLTDGSTLAFAYSVFVSGSDVYVSGSESNGTNHDAKLWKNGIAQDLTNNSIAEAVSVFVDDGQLSTETIVNPQNNISLYPNPVKDILQIETNQQITSISLYSITGQQLQSWKGKTSINLSGYDKGMYFIEIQTP